MKIEILKFQPDKLNLIYAEALRGIFVDMLNKYNVSDPAFIDPIRVFINKIDTSGPARDNQYVQDRVQDPRFVIPFLRQLEQIIKGVESKLTSLNEEISDLNGGVKKSMEGVSGETAINVGVFNTQVETRMPILSADIFFFEKAKQMILNIRNSLTQ
jgi:hypothetical protein